MAERWMRQKAAIVGRLQRRLIDRRRGRPGEARIVINPRQSPVRCREDNVRSHGPEVRHRFNQMDFCGHRTPHMRDDPAVERTEAETFR